MALAWIPALCVNAQYPLETHDYQIKQQISCERNIRDRVHERYVDLNRLCDQVLNFTKHREVVLVLDIVGVRSIQAGDEPTERGNANTLADSQYG